VLARILKTAESALMAQLAEHPPCGVSAWWVVVKTAWGASQGGTAINALGPAQAGTAAMIGIFRTSIPGSSVAGATSATVVQIP
jgi:hypothetical protein